MTSITLPLKKFPGHIKKTTIFGGRSIVTPLILLVRGIPTLYLYCCLNSRPFFSHNLLGFLPYLWGSALTVYHMKKSSQITEKLFKGNLSEIRTTFERGKKIFRRILKLCIILSFFNIMIPTQLFVLYGKPALLIISISSILSILLTVSTTILPLFSTSRIITYIGLVSAYEAIFTLIAFWGVWVFDIILLVTSLLIFFYHLDVYDLRRFLQRIIV